MNCLDAYFSRAHRYSIGTETVSNRRYLSIPVSARALDYEECYKISVEEFERFLADAAAAIEFAESCRRREQDDRLLLKPGWNRGTPS